LVIPVKIFEIKSEYNQSQFFNSLQGYQESEPYESETGSGELVTEILDLKMDGNLINGFLSKDFLRDRFYRRKMVKTPETEEAQFWITPYNSKSYLIVSAPSVARGVKKLLTGHVANKLDEIITEGSGLIVEAEIPHETLRELHESNPKATNLIWFDNVDIPDVEKLCLSGSGLADTQLYQGYIDHGKIWYVVFRVQEKEIVIGITRNSGIVLFSKSEIDDFIEYVRAEVFPLIDK
jgi:hypothetical protein